MKEQLISFETAKLAKEKGFETNYLYYDSLGYPSQYPYYLEFQSGNSEDNILNKLVTDSLHKDGLVYDYSPISSSKYYLAPTQSLLQKWLREKHNLYIVIVPFNDYELKQILWEDQVWKKSSEVEDDWELISTHTYYHSYEEALEVALLEALRLITNEKP